MTTDQEKTLAALKTAIKMEIDGKEFYLKSAQQSRNELGKALLNQLASEEDIHRKTFEQIYEIVRRKQAWPKTSLKLDSGKALRTIFARATEKLGSTAKTAKTELDAVQTAIKMEAKTYDYYTAQSKTAGYDAEKEYYQALAGQEREHQLVLLDYFEYLKDPGSWFVKTEHPSIDGG